MSTLSSVTRSIAYNGFFQNLIMTMPITPPQIIKRKRSLTVSSLSIPHNNETNKSMAEMVPIVSNRRVLNLSILTFLLWDPFSSFAVAIGGEVLELERYTDSAEGFTLLRPSSWIKVRPPFFAPIFETCSCKYYFFLCHL